MCWTRRHNSYVITRYLLSIVLSCSYLIMELVWFTNYTEAILLLWFFFFSSRRRHTRCSRDWSSDVCSSDLVPCKSAPRRGNHVEYRHPAQAAAAAQAVARNTGEHGTNHGAHERGGNGKPFPERRKMIERFERLDGSGDDDGVESEQQPSQCCNDSALQKRGI